MIGWCSVLVGQAIGFVFTMTHIIGMSLVKPFDDLVSGTALDALCRTIEINLLEDLNEETPPAIETYKGLYII